MNQKEFLERYYTKRRNRNYNLYPIPYERYPENYLKTLLTKRSQSKTLRNRLSRTYRHLRNYIRTQMSRKQAKAMKQMGRHDIGYWKTKNINEKRIKNFEEGIQKNRETLLRLSDIKTKTPEIKDSIKNLRSHILKKYNLLENFRALKKEKKPSFLKRVVKTLKNKFKKSK